MKYLLNKDYFYYDENMIDLVLIFTGASQISVSCQRVWEDHQLQNSRTSKGTVAHLCCCKQIVEVSSWTDIFTFFNKEHGDYLGRKWMNSSGHLCTEGDDACRVVLNWGWNPFIVRITSTHQSGSLTGFQQIFKS